MSLGPVIPFLSVALIASVTGMVHGAGRMDHVFTATTAAAFIFLVVLVAVIVNITALVNNAKSAGREYWSMVIRRNARLAALVYAWGAAAMFAVYSLSALDWRHSWQYGLGMALIAAGIMLYVFRMGRAKVPEMPPLWLTALHGAAVAAALAYLIGAGKLDTVKSDWAANNVFLYGGLGIVALCAISAVTQWRATRHARHS